MTCKIIFNRNQNNDNIRYFDISDGNACMVRCSFDVIKVGITDDLTISKHSTLKIKYKTTPYKGGVSGEIMLRNKNIWLGEIFPTGLNKDGSSNKSLRFKENVNQDIERRLNDNKYNIANFIKIQITSIIGASSLKNDKQYELLNEFLENISSSKTDENLYKIFKDNYIEKIGDAYSDKNIEILVEELFNKIYDVNFIVGYKNSKVFIPEKKNNSYRSEIVFKTYDRNNADLKRSNSRCAINSNIKNILYKLGWEGEANSYSHSSYGQESLF